MTPYWQLMRPAQWIKNLMVLAGPAFGLQLFDVRVLYAVGAFCLMSSASYIINDVQDRDADRAHPQKCHRPLASGAVKPGAAMGLAVLLGIASLGLCVLLPPLFGWIVASYFLLILAYSLFLKALPILDVIVIAVGFVLRAVGGAMAVEVYVSPWLIACTFTLCMFLGFGKRRCELATLGEAARAEQHRKTLLQYTPDLLNQLTGVSAGIAIMTFLLYTMDVSNSALQPPFKKEYLLYTLPLVAYALFRYAMLIESGRFAGPMEIILCDRALLLTGLLWLAVAGGVLGLTHDRPVPDVVGASIVAPAELASGPPVP